MGLPATTLHHLFGVRGGQWGVCSRDVARLPAVYRQRHPCIWPHRQPPRLRHPPARPARSRTTPASCASQRASSCCGLKWAVICFAHPSSPPAGRPHQLHAPQLLPAHQPPHARHGAQPPHRWVAVGAGGGSAGRARGPGIAPRAASWGPAASAAIAGRLPAQRWDAWRRSTGCPPPNRGPSMGCPCQLIRPLNHARLSPSPCPPWQMPASSPSSSRYSRLEGGPTRYRCSTVATP